MGTPCPGCGVDLPGPLGLPPTGDRCPRCGFPGQRPPPPPQTRGEVLIVFGALLAAAFPVAVFIGIGNQGCPSCGAWYNTYVGTPAFLAFPVGIALLAWGLRRRFGSSTG